MSSHNRLVPVAAASLVAMGVAGCFDNGNDDEPGAQPPLPPAATPGDIAALTNANRIVTFDRAAPAVRTSVGISGLQPGETALGIDIRAGGATPGQIYLVGSSGRLYTVDAATGVTTLKSTLMSDAADTTSPYSMLDGSEFGVDFNPVADRLRIVSNTGQNLRVNVDTGATFTDGPLNIGGVSATGVASAAYTNSFAAACRTSLVYIDSTTDRLLSSADPNAGSLAVIGALGVNGDGNSGFEIVTAPDGANTAFTVLSINGTPTLHSIALGTGTATVVGAVTGLNTGETLKGLAAGLPASAPAQALGSVLALTESNRVVSFNPTSPQKLCTTNAATGLQTGESLLGMDTRPADGTLIGIGSTGRLYTLNATSGVATLKATLAADSTDATAPFTGLSGTDFGVDFNPVPDRLRVVSNTGQNLRINVDTGATFTDTSLNPVGPVVTGAAYTNSFAGAGTTTLYAIDATGGRLMIQGQPSGNPNSGDLQAVGNLGVATLQSVGGFDISGANNSALLSVNLTGGTTSDLHTVDLVTGAATRVNAVGIAERVKGLTFAATPAAMVFGVTQDNRLVGFRATTPGTFDTNVAITGLQAGETVTSIDFRPADGRLYALSSAARVYVIDALTGAATLSSTLAADAMDTTDIFSMLSSPSFDVDFNPSVDRLRILGSTGQSLRINVATGATFTDGTLRRAAAGVTAAAYTNSFVGTTSTTLYVIDTASDRLLTQNPPNNGTLNDVGALGLDVTSVNGFEILGLDTGVAVLATTATPAGVYTMNLATGQAVLVGSVALAAGARITGVTGAPSAAAPPPGAQVYGLVNGNALLAFPLNAPASASAAAAISGLQAGETLLGIDIRAANGAMYGVGTSGRIYTIDPATAVATHASTLSADVTDLSDVFTALQGTAYGVDFNPVADRLRMVSDAQQNLRINVATGAVTTDGSLNFVAPVISAAAYTQNVAGTTATRLLGIDTATATLVQVNPPNDGTLAAFGRLDPALSLTATAGFDIAGGEDGLSLAALLPVGATQSSLYRVNTRTGAATVLGAVGPGGTAPLRSIAIRLQ